MSEILVRRLAELTPRESDDSVDQRLVLLERASLALELESPQAALGILDQRDPVSGPHAPTIEWGTRLLRSVCDIESGNVNGAAVELPRLVAAADSLPYVTWEFAKVALAHVYGLLGRHEDELTLLADVMQHPKPDPHDVALAHEQLANCLDRYCLSDLAWEQRLLGLRSLGASDASAHVRQLAALIRSGLNRDAVKPGDLAGYVRELESLVDSPKVWPRARADAGIALGQWHASRGDWSSVETYCLAYAPLVRQHFYATHPVAITCLTLEAAALVARGRHQHAIDLIGVVELDLGPQHSIEALLRTLVSAQRICGDWTGVARTNERLDELALTTRTNRRRIAYHSQLRHIAALERSEFELLEALSERDGVVTIVGHELRSPLSQIALELDRCRLLGDDGSLNEPEAVIGAYDQLLSTVDDVSLIGLIESSSVEARAVDVDLAGPIGRAVHSVLVAAHESGQVIEWQPETAALCWPTDERWVERIVAGFLTRSIRSCAPMDIIAIHVLASEADVVITVEDSGPGFVGGETSDPASAHSGLDWLATDGGVSRSLDWYMAKRLAGLLGGIVEARSPGPGHGATYSLSLPALDNAPSIG